MFLAEPSHTSYDINFTIFGFDVRVHPAFFIMPLVLGSSLLQGANAGMTLLTLIIVFFLSILVHELGHAFAYRYYGLPARIVLYWMGGLAIADGGSGPWAPRNMASLNPQQQIVVSAAGPAFGFVLAAVLIALVYAMGGTVIFDRQGIIPMIFPVFEQNVNHAVRIFFLVGIWANVFINIMNLAPVFPLDGGQIARQFLIMQDGFNGIRNSMMLSVIAGGAIALFSLAGGDRFLGFFFGFMAWSNYMTMQQMGGGYGGGFGGGRPW